MSREGYVLMASTKRAKAEYELNTAFLSVLSNRIFFCPRVRVLNERLRKVVGKKYDITDALQPYLLKKYRKKP